MFGYIKQCYEDEIDREMLEYEKVSNEKDEIKKEIISIDDYQHLLYELKDNKIGIAGYSTLTILFTILAILSSRLIYLFALVALLNDIQLCNQFHRNKKKKNSSIYRDYSNMTTQELNDRREELSKEHQSLRKKLETIFSKVNSCERSIKFIQDYEEQYKFFNTGSTRIMAADTLSEALEITDQYVKCMRNSLEDFLEEKVDYSTIHFNNEFEPGKKLIKKM